MPREPFTANHMLCHSYRHKFNSDQIGLPSRRPYSIIFVHFTSHVSSLITMTALRFKPSAFTPPQANIPQPPWMKATQGTIPIQVAQACILALPPITQVSVVRDSGSGGGNVTRSILLQRTLPTYPSFIHATDIVSELLSKLRTDVAHNKWPVATVQAPAQTPL